MNLNQRVNRYILVTALIMLACATIVILGFAYYAQSRTQTTDSEFALSHPCRLVDSVPIGSRIGEIDASTRISCGLTSQRLFNAIAIKHSGNLRIVLTENTGQVFESVADASNVFVLFQVQDESKCGYRYELVHITRKDTLRVGDIPVCSPIVRLVIARDFVSILTPSDELRKGFMQAYSYNFKARKWVNS